MTVSEPSWDQLDLLARRQAGVVATRQLRACGISPKTERTRIERGTWRRAGRAVVVDDSETDDLQRAWILQVEAGLTGIVSGPVAARLGGWALPGDDRIVILGEHDRVQVPGVRVLRRDDPAWPAERRGLRLARPIDALADTLICRSLMEARDLVDLALQQRWINPASFDELIGRRAGRGRRGVGRLRHLLPRVVSGSRSEAEHRMRPLLDQSGTGPWVANYPVYGPHGRVEAELDFALEALKIAVEVDGRAYHSDERAFERDRARQNRLVVAGWLVLRFTWEQIVHRPHEVIAAIMDAVDLRMATA